MTSAADLEKIVEGAGTKADRARKLFALGCERTDVVELLDMSYSQAHQIWKGMNGREAAVSRTAKGSKRADATDVPAITRSRRKGYLQLSPTQTRFITQDGHVVVKVDTERGAVCRNCDRELTFSLLYLGFIHTYSEDAPTDMEDRYE